MRYSILTRNIRPRRAFDPNKRSDVLEFKYFMENGKWKNICPFYIDLPWEDVPSMCKDRYAYYMLSRMK